MKKIIYPVIFNKKYLSEETNKVNHLIKSLSYHNLNISKNTLSNTDIGIYSIMKIVPIWKMKIDSIIKTYFFTNTQKEVKKFIKFTNQNVMSYEDTQIKMVELPLKETKNNKFSMGIVLNRNKDDYYDFDSLAHNVNKMKNETFGEIIIPLFESNNKIRLNNTLYKSGLENLYNNGELNVLFPEKCNFNQVLQYSYVAFTKKSGGMVNKRIMRNNKKFLCNRNFLYYLRDVELNLIMMVGQY
jgi:serine protease inhibitor